MTPVGAVGSEPMTQVVGVVQVKGGVGRSAIATNLAAIFSLKKPTAQTDATGCRRTDPGNGP